MKIKKGDSVKVVAGKDRGKTGSVVRAFPKKEMVLIEGVNIKTRHEKKRRGAKSGQIIEKPFPVHVSNVMIIDGKTSKASRIGYKTVGEKKVRIARKSGVEIA